MDITFLIIFLSFLPNLNNYFFNNHKYSKKKDDKFKNIFKRFTQYKNQLYKLKYSYKNNSSIFSVNINNKKCEDLNYKNIACTIFILEQNMKDNYRHINIILNNNKFNNLLFYLNRHTFVFKMTKIFKAINCIHFLLNNHKMY